MTAALLIAVMALVTALIRYLPFWLFGRKNNEVPAFVRYLGKYLPPAVMSVLVIYCVRNVDIMSGSHGLPEMICLIVAAALHFWRRNTLLSITVSTALYMVLVQNSVF